MKSYSLSEIEKFAPNKESLYKICSVDKGWYLPDLNSRAVTEEYLVKVLKVEAFRIRSKGSDYFQMEVKATCEELFEMIYAKRPDAYGFTVENLPNKKWLTDVLFNIDRDNKIFGEALIEETRILPEK